MKANEITDGNDSDSDILLIFTICGGPPSYQVGASGERQSI